MTNLINKLLAFFNLQLVSTKKEEYDLVEKTIKFMRDNPNYFDSYNILGSTYIGDINYVKERVKGEFPQISGKTYYEESYYGANKKYFNFDGEQYAPEELAEKLKND